MNNDERVKVLQELATHVTTQILDGLVLATRCCPNCTFWQGQTEQCRNTINCPQGPARPPADVIAFGCKLFVPDATL